VRYTQFNLDRSRLYDGPPHMVHGDRGRQMVEGLTVRDVHDAFVRAVFLATGLNEEERREDGIADLYDIDFSELDPGAIGQSLMCELERMMGIYPNIPEALTAAIERQQEEP
jgi:hypothetical protein